MANDYIAGLSSDILDMVLSSLPVQDTHVSSHGQQEVCSYAPEGCDSEPDEPQAVSHQPEEHLADIFTYMLWEKEGYEERREEAYSS